MMLRKTILFVFIICAFAIKAHSQNVTAFTHEVGPGETLYSISVKYGVSVSDLKEANALSSDAIVVGQTLRVVKRVPVADASASSSERPDCRLMYKVQKKETVYGICKKFGLTEEELCAANPILLEKKLKKNQLICIPYKQEVQVVEEEVVVEESVEPMKIVLMLPFDLGEEEVSSTTLKMLDFYEGFLLALESSKALGLSVNVHVYDEVKADSLGVMSCFSNDALDGTDLLVGPYSAQHLEQMIPFVTEKRINALVPFTSKVDYTLNNSNVFQLNVPQASFYSKVYDLFLENNADKNLIFLLANDRTDNTLYFEGFKKSASERGVDYKVVDINALDEFRESMSIERENVFVPMSSSEKVFNRVVKTLDNLEITSSVKVSLFGQSNWMQFTEKHKDAFQKYDCAFFTKFLCDPSDEDVARFLAGFKQRFGREQYPSYPMYGVMGYDLGMYFLCAYNRFGEDYANHLSELDVETIQTPLHFERKGANGGFFNNRVMFVKFGANGALEKRVY